MRIGLFGGRFDPPHIGHLIAADQACELLELDEVHFIPSQSPPHKPTVAAGRLRYEMTLLATAPDARFQVSRVELEREGPSYTFDTVQEVKKRYPSAQLYFITGSDAYGDIASWHRAEELVNEIFMVAVSRPGYNLNSLTARFRERVRVLDTVECAVSSTLIRQRIAAGATVRYLVPELVERYLVRHHLYRQPMLSG